MIKKIWDAIHFGRFVGEWRNDPPTPGGDKNVALGQTLFYESHLEKSGDGWKLITKRGGYIGRIAFWLALPIYAVFALGLAMGAASWAHLILAEIVFISVFGLANGWALHRLAQDPGYGIEELSMHQIQKAD
ncbi:MAG: hypothetical protein CMK09_03605 [Ponticaulis sp.]|nr:hypothetical protein [Ponticaulis sp.]|tara:strand:- start:18788 stop:19183 length:396 start_codon:yes stop_codon:yes gene_type:complete